MMLWLCQYYTVCYWFGWILRPTSVHSDKSLSHSPGVFSLLSASHVLDVTSKCTEVQFNFLFISCFLIGKWQKLCPGNKSSLFAYSAVIGLNIDGLAKSHCILVVIGYANWVLLLGFWILVWFSVAVAYCVACWGMLINQPSPNNYWNS